MQADLSLWLPRQGHFPKDNAIPTPHQGRAQPGTSRELRGALQLPSRRSDLLPAPSLFLGTFTHF